MSGSVWAPDSPPPPGPGLTMAATRLRAPRAPRPLQLGERRGRPQQPDTAPLLSETDVIQSAGIILSLAGRGIQEPCLSVEPSRRTRRRRRGRHCPRGQSQSFLFRGPHALPLSGRKGVCVASAQWLWLPVSRVWLLLRTERVASCRVPRRAALTSHVVALWCQQGPQGRRHGASIALASHAAWGRGRRRSWRGRSAGAQGQMEQL